MKIISYAGSSALGIDFSSHQALYLLELLEELAPQLDRFATEPYYWDEHGYPREGEMFWIEFCKTEGMRKLLRAIYQIDTRWPFERSRINILHLNNLYQLIIGKPPINQLLETRVALSKRTDRAIWLGVSRVGSILLSQVKADGVDPFDPEALRDYLKI